MQPLRRFFDRYTEGLEIRDVRRLFDRDAAEAFAVLTRDQDRQHPTSLIGRAFTAVRLFLLGLAFHLTPARRLLFALALLFALFGALGLDIRIFPFVLFPTEPLWYPAATLLLIYLLALELVDRIRVRDELEVARQLQHELLPLEVPQLPGWEIEATYRTANEVGGDVYDFRGLPDGRLAIVVGDASGHGMAAGLLMAIANTAYHLALDLDSDPPSVLSLLNRALVRVGGRRAFLTAVVGRLDPATGLLELASAAHPFPVLRRPGGDLVELGRGSLPLGLRAEIEVEATSIRMRAGETLLLYTDGLVEAMGRNDQAFGYERLHQALRPGGTAAETRMRILAAFDEHRGDEPLRDDLSLVILRRAAD